MASGRKAKTAAQKTLEGNPGKRPIKSHLTAEIKIPQPPSHMGLEAQKVFIETAQNLFHLGVMTGLDTLLLEQYAENYAMMVTLQTFITKNGMTYEAYTKSGVSIRPRPEVNILNQCRQMHRQYSGELGLTPASRTKLPDANQADLFASTKSAFSEFVHGRVN